MQCLHSSRRTHLHPFLTADVGIRLHCAQYTTSNPPPTMLLCENIFHSIPQFDGREDNGAYLCSTAHKAFSHQNMSCTATAPLDSDIHNIQVRVPTAPHLPSLPEAGPIGEISMPASRCFETAG